MGSTKKKRLETKEKKGRYIYIYIHGLCRKDDDFDDLLEVLIFLVGTSETSTNRRESARDDRPSERAVGDVLVARLFFLFFFC